MTINIGRLDRTVRIVAGITVIGLGIYFGSWLGAIGIIPLVTALSGWCPAYSIFGINSCGKSSCCGSSTCETTK